MQEQITLKTTTHNQYISDLRSLGAQTKGFHDSLLRVVGGKHSDPTPLHTCDHCDISRWLGEITQDYRSVVPDAFEIDTEVRLVTVYEVEVTHPLTNVKREKYKAYFWMLDEVYWRLRVITVDKHFRFDEVMIVEL